MLLFCDVCGKRTLTVRYTLYRAWEDSEHIFCSLRCLREWLGQWRQHTDMLEYFRSRRGAIPEYFTRGREEIVEDLREPRAEKNSRGQRLNSPDWFKKGKAEIIKDLKEEELEIVTRVEKALENIISFDSWAWCAGLYLFDFACFKGAVELCFDFEQQTVTLNYNEDYALSLLSGETIMEIIQCYKGHVNWMEEQHRKLELMKLDGDFVDGDGKQMIRCTYDKEYKFDQVDQLVKDIKYLLYSEEEPEENNSDSEFDWDHFEEAIDDVKSAILAYIETFGEDVILGD